MGRALFYKFNIVPDKNLNSTNKLNFLNYMQRLDIRFTLISYKLHL